MSLITKFNSLSHNQQLAVGVTTAVLIVGATALLLKKPDPNKPPMSGFPDHSVTIKNRSTSSLNLTGKNIAIVGGTDGLGRSIAQKAASRGAKVLVVGRTFRDAKTPNISFLKADLTSVREAQSIAKDLHPETLDILIFTTGIFASPQRQVTPEGLERDHAISYYSRVAIINAIRDKIGTARPASAPKPRIFVMAFPGAGQFGDPNLDNLQGEQKYDAMTVHMNTVAGNEALMLYHADKTPTASFYGLNPGLIKTNIRNNYLGANSWSSYFIEGLLGLFTQSPSQYASKILPLLVAPELEGRTGVVFNNKGQAILASRVLNEERVGALVGKAEEAIQGVVGE
ncbi:hypothetical protein HDV00_009734 [Rhizophlyctis rosea]|nr:hypothetical protein HDV00_009734 [Rhizophlyctis rosea]